MKSLIFILNLILTMAITIQSQNICQSCIDINSNNFTCNNIGCNGFILTPTQNSSLNFNTINCLNGGQCYYTSTSPVSSISYVVYLFCNSTFPGCLSCQNGQTCSQCQSGYFYNVYEPTLEFVNCKLCEQAIGGCETCATSSLCSQCSAQYLNIFGFCYKSDGTIVGDTSKPWNKFGSTATQIISTIEVIVIFLILYFVLYMFCCKKHNPSPPRYAKEPAVQYTDRQTPLNPDQLRQ